MDKYQFPVNLNLLVAEDEVASSLYIKTLLKKITDGELYIAKNGQEAWEYFQQNHQNLDAVITDINMPLMDGIQLTRNIREIDTDIPVIYTTAFDNTNLLLQAIELGVYQYILKPVQSKNLEKVLLDLFDKKITKIKFLQQYEYNKILSQALEDSISMIAILDGDNTIQFVNKSFREFLKTSPDKFIGKKITDFAFDAQNPEEVQNFIEAVENRRSYKGELLLINSLGQPYWSSISHTPFFNENNEYIYAIDIIEDITAKKLSEEQLRKTKELLESMVEKRTQELLYLNEQLKEEIQKRIKYEIELAEAKEYAEKANEAKSIFLAKVSHELRTPMNGILGIASIMKDMNLDPKSRKFVEIIYNSAENLLTIINDLLDFSKIKTGKFQLNKRQFDFFEEMNQTIELIKPLAQNKSLDFIQKIDPNIPKSLYGDVERAKQVLWNILSNAIKFTKEGFVNLEIKLVQIQNNKVEIEFIVQDTGIGIPDNKKDIIFESFMQLEPLFTRNYGGTGLGLSISKEIIDLMEGKIYFESKLGQGTTFFFTLVFELEEPSLAEAKQKQTQKIEFTNENQNLNYFLVISSDKSIHNDFEELLSETNIKIFNAENIYEALDIFKLNPTDTIFIDHAFEKNTITTFINEIRKAEIDLKKHTPLVLMHFPTDKMNRDEMNAYGIDYFIDKPIRSRNLTDLLNEINLNTTQHIVEIDLEELLRTNSEEVILKIIDHFQQNYQPLLSKLEEAILNTNFRKIYEYASQIRSQISNFGVFRAVQIATRLSKKAIENDSENLEILFNALKWEINQIVNFFNNNQFEKFRKNK